jgi:hypothetical protein
MKVFSPVLYIIYSRVRDNCHARVGIDIYMDMCVATTGQSEGKSAQVHSAEKAIPHSNLPALPLRNDLSIV